MKNKTLVLITLFFGLTVSACSNVKYHTVKFDTRGGNNIPSETVRHGDKVKKPEDPTKSGYQFINWTCCDEDWSFVGYPVTEDVTLDANWSIIYYNINYIDEKRGDNHNPHSYTVEDSIILSDSFLTGYSFLGWYDVNGNCISTIPTGSTGDLTLTARWNDGDVYTVTLDPNGGDVESTTISVQYGHTYVLPTPTRLGYSFNGWRSGSVRISDEGVWKYTYDRTFQAYWTLDTYYVFYNLDGGTLESSNPNTYNVNDNYTLASPSKTGYVFEGWFDSNGNQITSLGQTVVGNYSLTARWSAKLNNLVIASEDEEKGSVKIVSGSGYSGETIIVSATPSEGYGFKGWYLDNKKISDESTYTFTMPITDYSLTARFFYLTPLVVDTNLSDVATPNMSIVFNGIDDNVMVTPKIKAYVDAMKEQEKTLDKPYHFSPLYGPDDYVALAAMPDKPDGTTYSPEDTGGVDVCQMLNRNDYGNTTENIPIVLTWDNGDLTFESAKLKFWSTEDQSDIREVDLTANATSASLSNLFRSTKYRVQLITDDNRVSQGFEFATGDYPRTISMGGIPNVRDIGGYMTSYGVRTRQGLIYRGYYIEDKSGGHGINFNDQVQQVQREVLHIGREIDLQAVSETNGRTESCLEGASYSCYTLLAYEKFLTQESYQNLPNILHKRLRNLEEKHLYIHCWGGADRTGMLSFFINAILGVSYTDLLIDYEITTETNNHRCHMHNSSNAHFSKFLNAFINGWDGYDANKTINENCENWLVNVAGVNSSVIETIRSIMLPGYADGEVGNLVPRYTAKNEWHYDALSHWQLANEDENVKCNWGRHTGSQCTVCGYGTASNFLTNTSNALVSSRICLPCSIPGYKKWLLNI